MAGVAMKALMTNRAVKGSMMMAGLAGIITAGAEVATMSPAAAATMKNCRPVFGGQVCLTAYGSRDPNTNIYWITDISVGFYAPPGGCFTKPKAQGYGGIPTKYTQAVLFGDGCYPNALITIPVNDGFNGNMYCSNVAWGGPWWDQHPCVTFV
jgi:hypothetical protein